MRWGSSGDNGFGVGASAYSFVSRDENASYYYYHEPTIPSTTNTLDVPQTGQARGVLQAKKPFDKRQMRRSLGAKTRSREVKSELCTTDEVATDGPEVVFEVPELRRQPPMIECAGKSIYGQTNDARGNNERSGSDTNQHNGEVSSSTLENWLMSDTNDSDSNCNNRPIPQSSGKIRRPSEPPQHRTDEELEQIIRDLRDQVFRQQHLAEQEKPNRNQNFETDDTQKHQRKHFKSPVEKMEGAVVSVPVAASSLTAPSGILLQRPLSSSCLNRLVPENTIQMVVPAVIHEANPTTNRGSSRLSGSTDARPNAKPRPGSSSSGDKFSLHSGDNDRLNPRYLRAKKFSGSTRRGDKEPERYHVRHERASDNSESFLYLVDVDDSEDRSESLSLSPVGPWVVDDFPSAGIGTATPRSPSVSTCYSVSSLGSYDIDNTDGTEWSNSELAALSPRSRLLYFSACADDCDTSRAMFSQQHQQMLRRSACANGLVANSRLSGLETHSSRHTRCSSAKAAIRTRTRPTSSGTLRQKTANRAHQTRKRPQSGGSSNNNQH